MEIKGTEPNHVLITNLQLYANFCFSRKYLIVDLFKDEKNTAFLEKRNGCLQIFYGLRRSFEEFIGYDG